MIIEYHRPETLDEALELLARKDLLTVPMGGGSVLSQKKNHDFAVVDLQKLGLDKIQNEGRNLTVGATATLQQIHDFPDFPENLKISLLRSIYLETSNNQRRMATIAGTLVCCDGRSPFATALLALDTRLVWAPGDEYQSLSDFLHLREPFGHERLLLSLRIPTIPELKFEMVSRTPTDWPIVCAAAAVWPSGRTRVALGGYGSAPILVMDGSEAGGAVVSAREAYRFAQDDWGSAAYRMDVAGRLVQRLLDNE